MVPYRLPPSTPIHLLIDPPQCSYHRPLSRSSLRTTADDGCRYLAPRSRLNVHKWHSMHDWALYPSRLLALSADWSAALRYSSATMARSRNVRPAAGWHFFVEGPLSSRVSRRRLINRGAETLGLGPRKPTLKWAGPTDRPLCERGGP